MNIKMEDFIRLQKVYQPDFKGETLEKGSIRLFATDEDGVKHSIVLPKSVILNEIDPGLYKRIFSTC